MIPLQPFHLSSTFPDTREGTSAIHGTGRPCFLETSVRYRIPCDSTPFFAPKMCTGEPYPRFSRQS
jgi:hypothetical protein